MQILALTSDGIGDSEARAQVVLATGTLKARYMDWTEMISYARWSWNITV
jgi:hypothetical protein